MSRFKVLILGAGASGIAAASRLIEKGVTDLAVLEAENRIGGRLHTVDFDGNVIEIGAEWVHGEKDNIVYQLASPFGLLDNTSMFMENITRTSAFHSSGFAIDPEISRRLYFLYNEIMQFDESDLKGFEGSLGEYFKAQYYKKIDEMKAEIDVPPKLAEEYLEFFEKWENSIDGSPSWYETSAKGHCEYLDCDGNILTIWKSRGYKAILDVLMKKYPDPNHQLPVESKVILNKKVTKINWNQVPKTGVPDVRVECNDGSVYHADHLIITFSLGVLKDKGAQMFTPSLPLEKLTCIQGLGFGLVDKLFLTYQQPWWIDDIDGFGFVWSKEEKERDESGWLTDVICFHPMTSNPSILRGWIIGAGARKMETLTDAEVIEGCTFLFKKFMAFRYEIPEPKALLRSKWYTNPNFGGSYSCRMVESDLMNVWASQLAQPVCNSKGKPVLLFAGEATHDHYFSTVHGAIETGHREADRLLNTNLTAPISNKYQVIIIGAGVSGLGAAKTLFENGIKDVLIIEAQPVPGGRINSVKIDQDYLELGAQWIHGEKNEVFRIAHQNHLLSDHLSKEGEGIYLRENGEAVDNYLVKEMDDFIKDVLENCEQYVNWDSNFPVSIAEELTKKFTEYLNNEQADDIKLIKKELFDWHLRFHVIDNSCTDLNDLSAKAWGLYEFCGGNDYVNFKNGYVSFIDFIISCLPKNVLLCSTPVRRVEWVKESHVKTHVPNGCLKSTDKSIEKSVEIICENNVRFNAEYLIVTNSLGYLKEHYRKMFNPELPEYISQAIDKMGYGVIDKIFVIYDEPWWDVEVKGFQLIWSNESNTRPWARNITGFDVISNEKPYLLGWIGGEGAKAMEEMDENELALEITTILKTFTKNENIPMPKKILRSRWWRNRYIRGGYSHITTECDHYNVDGSHLSRPVTSTLYKNNEVYEKPTILFAGEATHKTHFSTVHGAYQTGIDQANRIINDIRNREQV